MSNSDINMNIRKEETSLTLRVRVSNEYKYFIKITLFDSNNRIIETSLTGSNETIFLLKQGIYTLRIEMNGEIKDEVFLLDKEMEYEISDYNINSSAKLISPPMQFSSALLNKKEYSSTHEYYTIPVMEWSRKNTFPSPSDPAGYSDSSLFIFLRFPSVEKYKSLTESFQDSFYKDFEIVDKNGTTLTKFETGYRIIVDLQYGWVAFNAVMPAGIYYLIYNGEEPRQIPIYVFRNWHTQFFMTLGSKPSFGTIRIFLSRQRIFDPFIPYYQDSNYYKFIDILLDKLQNGNYSLDKELLENVAYGKYESPMLGLICAYIYLKSNDTKEDRLFRAIINNLQNIILKDNFDAPDLQALNIMASSHFPGYHYPETSINGTPMFRTGFEAILKASVSNNKLIPKNSINDYISENLYYDTPFNTFAPIPFNSEVIEEAGTGEEEFPDLEMDSDFDSASGEPEDFKPVKGGIFRKIDIGGIGEFFGWNKKRLKVKINSKKQDKYSTSIRKLLDDNILLSIKDKSLPDISKSWLKFSISDMISKNDKLSINDISGQLNVSGNTVQRIIDEWKGAKGINR